MYAPLLIPCVHQGGGRFETGGGRSEGRTVSPEMWTAFLRVLTQSAQNDQTHTRPTHNKKIIPSTTGYMYVSIQ